VAGGGVNNPAGVAVIIHKLLFDRGKFNPAARSSSKNAGKTSK
jgi:hypothetical protein